MAKTDQGRRKSLVKKTGKKVASHRRLTPTTSKRSAVSDRFLPSSTSPKRQGERVKAAVTSRQALPQEFASAGMIEDSELQSTEVKKYIRTRLGDRS